MRESTETYLIWIIYMSELTHETDGMNSDFSGMVLS
jgi:hypothetical protein